MTAKRIYSCNFCRSETTPMVGVYWKSDAGHEYLEPRMLHEAESHICKKCFDAIRGIHSVSTWQKPKEST